MQLLPGWKEKIESVKLPVTPPTPQCRIPLNAACYKTVNYVTTAEAAENMLALARQIRLSRVGIDTEFQYAREPVTIRGRRVYCCRDIRPLLLSLALVEPHGDSGSRILRDGCSGLGLIQRQLFASFDLR